MSGPILVVCETDNGQCKKNAYELLSKASSLASELGVGVEAAVVAKEAIASVGDLGGYGATKVHAVSGADFQLNNTGSMVAALTEIINSVEPSVVLAAATPQGKEILPRVAARNRFGMGADVTELRIDDIDGEKTIIGRRPQFSGKAFSDVLISSSTKIFTARPNSFSISEKGSAQAEVVNVDVELEDADSAYKEIGREESVSEVVDLTEADRIVSGGRSVKSKDGFDSLIRPLASSIGATPGASRAAVDAGYAAHSEQVGQTGKVVNPSLYIACGISGAIQHLAGMRSSRVIVAINKDKDAPIFKHATYGIVADMFDVVPPLTKALGDGTVPSVAAPAAQESKSSATPATAEKAPAKEVASKSVESKPVETKPVEKKPVASKAPTSKATAPAAPVSAAAAQQAPAVVQTAAIDPALFEKLKSEMVAEIAALKAELTKTQANLAKSIKSLESSQKSEIQRVEKNARAFQESGVKRYEDLDNRVVSEIRKVRETLREGISNDTSQLHSSQSAISTTTIASLVVSILCLCILLMLMMK